ncbi:MAG: hypothetical protein JNJ72_20265, partial [Anaerolineales bacterium]|nr:hypothetical protein [Anaerolineales bacterium]
VDIIIDHDAEMSSFSWGSDSRLFAFGTSLWSISTIDDPSIVIDIGMLTQWVDNTHLLRIYDDNDGVKIRMAEINEDSARIYILGDDMDVASYVFIKPK